MALKDVYNMDETNLFYCAQPNKTLAQRKNHGHKTQKGRLTLALVVNMACINKLQPIIIYNSLCPSCLEGGWQHVMCGGLQTVPPR